MIRNELIRRSPLRILENSTHGGISRGDVGVFAGYQGVGKTACLVHIGTDQLFQDKHIIHVSFSADTNHILAWYDDIFQELQRRHKLEDALQIHDSIVKNRIILNFKQNGVHWPEVQHGILTIINNGKFNADTVIVDGFDFSQATSAELHALKDFALQAGIEIWFSASLLQKPNHTTIPPELQPFAQDFSVIIVLMHKDDHIHLALVKDHANQPQDLHLKLDPQLLLIAEE